MPRLPCHLCSNWVTVKLKHYRVIQDEYIAICYSGRNYHRLEEIPEELRCRGTTSKNERCKSWANFNQRSEYCAVHKGENK